MTTSFRFQHKKLFLTYATHLIDDDFSTIRQEGAKVAFANETGDTGHQHCHAIVLYAKRLNTRNPRHWDIRGHHPNVKILRTNADLQRVYEYIRKQTGETTGDNIDSAVSCGRPCLISALRQHQSKKLMGGGSPRFKPVLPANKLEITMGQGDSWSQSTIESITEHPGEFSTPELARSSTCYRKPKPDWSVFGSESPLDMGLGGQHWKIDDGETPSVRSTTFVPFGESVWDDFLSSSIYKGTWSPLQSHTKN